jgi:hypothetical protein
MPKHYCAGRPQVNVNLPDPKMRTRLMHAAAERDQTVSAFIRTAIRKELRSMGQDR